jgi:hypothetical protein
LNKKRTDFNKGYLKIHCSVGVDHSPKLVAERVDDMVIFNPCQIWLALFKGNPQLGVGECELLLQSLCLFDTLVSHCKGPGGSSGCVERKEKLGRLVFEKRRAGFAKKR